MTKDNRYLLEVNNLVTTFPRKGGFLNKKVGEVLAVNNVSFKIEKGSTMGLVGESGCGKTTLGRSILRLIEPKSGEVIFDGVNITKLDNNQMRAMRRKMQIIFQDPYASLNPRMNVRSILAEPLRINDICISSDQELKKIYTLLDYVQLPKDAIYKYPHEFSGGQRQRISIARALAVEPEFIVCDESVSALDVSVQSQIVNLLMDLQDELGLTYLFISHDLKVIEFISHYVAVMYLGNIVEFGKASDIYHHSRHPYTKALISAIPDAYAVKTKRIILNGDVPSNLNPPSGCPFHPRCWKATSICAEANPGISHENDSHTFRCYHPLND
jgi:oligopeptide/dipeptide ABC transporter ATP-binding protein